MFKILVIDDEAALLEEIYDSLKLAGYKICVSADGAQGLAMAQQEKPDLILSDVMMPGLTGYDLLKQIRQIPEIAQTPLVFMTAAADLKSMRYAMTLGADDYIAKPFTIAELMNCIDIRLKRHQDIVQQNQEALDAAKKQLMVMVSHELRTPLVAIMGVSELIEEELERLAPEEVQKLLQVMNRGSQRLHRITEKIIFLTQVESGLMKSADWDVIRVQHLLSGAIDAARQMSRAAGVSIQLPHEIPALSLRCHTQLMTQAFAELLANALNFSPANGVVRVRFTQRGEVLELSIEDQGCGMPPEMLEKVMQPFEQANREVYEQQGVGLGLTLAARVIEQHQGQVQLESTLNQGTTVRVLLPIC